MKRIMMIAFAMLLVLCLTACGLFAQQSEPTQDQTEATQESSNIVLSPEEVQKFPCYGTDGNPTGFCQFTYGTNEGVYGLMLIEFMDLDGNVLNSYSPKLPGYQFSDDPNIFYEHDNQGSENPFFHTNSYRIYPDSLGALYSYIETRDRHTIKCELYDPDGNVIASLLPLDPKNLLHIDFTYVFPEEEGIQDYFLVEELDSESKVYRVLRRIYYKTNGEFICDLRYIYADSEEHSSETITRIEAANQNGEVVRVFNQPAGCSSFSGSYDADYDTVNLYGLHQEGETIYAEGITCGIYKTIFKQRVVYVNGEYSHTELERDGGKIEMTNGSIPHVFKKMDFYDAQGNLIKTVVPPEGGYLTQGWRMTAPETYTILVGVYDAQGNKVETARH